MHRPRQPDGDTLFLSSSHEEVFTPEIAADVAVPGTASDVLDVNTLLAFGVVPASFAIAGGADAAAFTVDPVTGMLSFNTQPDFEAPTDVDSITRGAGLEPSVSGDNVYEVVLRVVDANGVEDLVGVLVHVDDVFGRIRSRCRRRIRRRLARKRPDGRRRIPRRHAQRPGRRRHLHRANSATAVQGGAGTDTVEMVRDVTHNLLLVETGNETTVSDGSIFFDVEALSYTGSEGADVFDASAVTSQTLDLNRQRRRRPDQRRCGPMTC